MGSVITKPIDTVATELYPAYQSFKALSRVRSKDSSNEINMWLTYWIVFSLTTSAERVSSKLMFWVPGYYFTRTLFFVWLVCPKTKGALKLYNCVIQPLLKKYEPLIDENILRINASITKKLEETTSTAKDSLKKKAHAISNASVTKILLDFEKQLEVNSADKLLSRDDRDCPSDGNTPSKSDSTTEIPTKSESSTP